MTTILFVSSAQTTETFNINKHAIVNGGGQSSGVGYRLIGSIAQIDATTELSSNNFRLKGGFWNNTAKNDIIFKNRFE